MPRLTLRDLFWLVLVVSCLCGWWVDRTATKRYWWRAFTHELNERVRFQSYYESLSEDARKRGLEIDTSGERPKLKPATQGSSQEQPAGELSPAVLKKTG